MFGGLVITGAAENLNEQETDDEPLKNRDWRGRFSNKKKKKGIDQEESAHRMRGLREWSKRKLSFDDDSNTSTEQCSLPKKETRSNMVWALYFLLLESLIF